LGDVPISSLNDPAKKSPLPDSLPLEWHTSKFTHLGICIPPFFLNVSFKNYVTLKSKIQANFQRWSSLKLTLQGRIVLSKDEYTWAFTFFVLHAAIFST